MKTINLELSEVNAAADIIVRGNSKPMTTDKWELVKKHVYALGEELPELKIVITGFHITDKTK